MGAPSTTAAPQPGRLHWWLCAATALAVTIFAWRQNHAGVVGGPISTVKAFWLGCTLTVFFILPFALWRNERLAPAVRRVFGWAFASFAARGLIELAIIYGTRAWKCGYGIGHDLFTFALVGALAWQVHAPAPHDRRALSFQWILMGTLLIEAYMAWRFHLVASPADGVYFAADQPLFEAINRISAFAVAAVLGALLWFGWRTRRDF